MIKKFEAYKSINDNISDLWDSIENRSFYSFLSAIKYDDLDEKNEQGDTPLIYSVWISNMDFIIPLIRNGADVYVISHTNTTFIDLVKKLMPKKYKKIYKEVLKKHPNFEEEYKIRKESDKFNL